MELARGLVAIGAGIAVMTGLLASWGQSYATAKAVESVAKNPEAESKIRSMLILGVGIAESCAIYGFLIALLLIFVFK